jgi:hypothetical protein
MFYRKSIRQRRVKKVRLSFGDFLGGVNARADKNLLSFRYSPLAYNFATPSGALTHTKGIGELVIGQKLIQPIPGESIGKLYFYKRYDPGLKAYDDKLLAYCVSKKLYYLDIEGEESEFKPLEGISFERAPACINYRLHGDDVIIMCSEYDGMAVWDGKNPPYKVENAPKISTMCVHYERLFATVDGEKSAVWFSDDLDPTNWDISLDEAGYIEIIDEKGALQKVLKFLDYVYIFRSYGISRLTAYAEQTEFSVINLFVSSGKIFPETVTVCGDRIIFLAEDGLFSSDGISTARIAEGIFPLLEGNDNKGASSAYFNGCYYLACRADFGEQGEEGNNALLEYDVRKGRATLIRAKGITSLSVISTESVNLLAMSVEGRPAMLVGEGSFFGEPLEKYWQTPQFDFSAPGAMKVLRNVFLYTDTDIELGVVSDLGSKKVRVSGGEGERRVAVNLKGRTFRLEFACRSAHARISKVTAVCDVLEG